MVTIPTQKLQEMIEDYTMEIKNLINPNSVPSYLYPLQSFFESNDVDLRWKKIKRLFPAEIKKTGKTAYTNADIVKMLQHTPDLRNQTIIHFLASSGCRIGALTELKIKHLTKMDDCYAVLIYEDSIEEYYTFLTPEASKKLDDYFEKRKSDREYMDLESPVFRRKYLLGIEKVYPMSTKAISSVVLRALRNSGVRDSQIKKRGRYEKQADHGFRKRFITILKTNKNIPVAYTERLAGHKVYTDELGNKITLDASYLTPEISKLYEIFSEGIPELTIDKSERLRKQNERQQKQLSKLQKKQVQVVELEAILKKKDKEVDQKIQEKMEEWKEEFLNQIEGVYDKQRKETMDRIDKSSIIFEKELNELKKQHLNDLKKEEKNRLIKEGVEIPELVEEFLNETD